MLMDIQAADWKHWPDCAMKPRVTSHLKSYILTKVFLKYVLAKSIFYRLMMDIPKGEQQWNAWLWLFIIILQDFFIIYLKVFIKKLEFSLCESISGNGGAE